MNRARFALLACALLAVAPAWSAKMYKWVDQNGKVHYSDRVPPDQVKQAREELNQQGVAVKQTEAAKTPEQIAAAREAARLAAEAKRLAEQQRRADEALLNSYATEDDLTRNYEQNLELIEQQIISTNADIELRQKNLDQLVARAAQSEQAGRAVDATISKLIEQERAEIARQKAFAAAKAGEKSAAEADYQAKLKNFREVMARSKGG